MNTDSMFVVDCFQQRWIHSWLSNGWIKSDGKPVKNKKQFRELLLAMKNMDVKWVLGKEALLYNRKLLDNLNFYVHHLIDPRES